MVFRSIFLCLGTVLLFSCTVPPEPPMTNSTPTTMPTDPSQETLPDVVSRRVKANLAAQLGVAADQLVIDSYSRETFSDGCLGLGGPAEGCIAVLTEGWQVEVVNPETSQSYIYRSDLAGEQIRQASPEQIGPS